MASLISIRIACYCPAHSASYWICICAARHTHTHTHSHTHTNRLLALIHLLPALSTNDAISFFIVLLIHKIHFSNQITVLRPNSITGSFGVFFAETKTKQTKMNSKRTMFNISAYEEAESLLCSSSLVFMLSLGSVYL